MKTFKFSVLFVFVGVLLFSACKSDDSDNKSGVSATVQAILPEFEEGVIRGVAMNASVSAVKGIETDSLLAKETPQQLEYVFNSGKDAVSVLYEFDTEGLFKISISAKTSDLDAAKKLEAELLKVLTEKFGAFKSEGKFNYNEMKDRKLAVEISRKLKNVELIVKYFDE